MQGCKSRKGIFDDEDVDCGGCRGCKSRKGISDDEDMEDAKDWENAVP